MALSPLIASSLIETLRVNREHAEAAEIWRDLARCALHQLADQRRQLRLLQERHARLLDEYQHLRETRMQEAA